MLLVVAGSSISVAVPIKPILQTIGGLREFVNTVRSHFGKAADFSNQNGFDYSNVYNSLLQYFVMNAYVEKANYQLLVEQKEQTAAFREETVTYQTRDTTHLLVLINLNHSIHVQLDR